MAFDPQLADKMFAAKDDVEYTDSPAFVDDDPDSWDFQDELANEGSN